VKSQAVVEMDLSTSAEYGDRAAMVDCFEPPLRMIALSRKAKWNDDLKAAHQSIRVLIVEDRESMRLALRSLVCSRKEFTVCGEAEDGKQAVAMAEQLQPDLIIMDYSMQPMDGLTAAKKILERRPSLPIVMFTLFKTSTLEAEAERAGIRCVIGKEEGASQLLHALEEQV
jgi:CheY-like chemotaxis protein